MNEWTSKQVDCEERQGNKLIVKEDKVTGKQGVKAYDIWGEKDLKKARN